jgi:hypothetical protein
MFERYPENARQVIFFAQKEASRFGSSCIESEHLLLGTMRSWELELNELLNLKRLESALRVVATGHHVEARRGRFKSEQEDSCLCRRRSCTAPFAGDWFGAFVTRDFARTRRWRFTFLVGAGR